MISLGRISNLKLWTLIRSFYDAHVWLHNVKCRIEKLRKKHWIFNSCGMDQNQKFSTCLDLLKVCAICVNLVSLIFAAGCMGLLCEVYGSPRHALLSFVIRLASTPSSPLIFHIQSFSPSFSTSTHLASHFLHPLISPSFSTSSPSAPHFLHPVL